MAKFNNDLYGSRSSLVKHKYLFSKSKFDFGNCILHVMWVLEQGKIDISWTVTTLKHKSCGCEILLAVLF